MAVLGAVMSRTRECGGEENDGENENDARERQAKRSPEQNTDKSKQTVGSFRHSTATCLDSWNNHPLLPTIYASARVSRLSMSKSETQDRV